MSSKNPDPSNVHLSRTPHGSYRSLSGRVYSLMLRCLAASTVAFLWFAPFLSKFFDERNRCYARWEVSDALVVLAVPILLALVCVGASELIRQVGRPILNRMTDHLFVMALGGGLLTVFFFQAKDWLYWFSCKLESFSINPPAKHVYTDTAWMLLIVVVVYSFARSNSKLVSRSRRVCMILSPLVAILAGQLLVQRTYPLRMDPLVVASPQLLTGDIDHTSVKLCASRESLRPIYLFVFDEWSHNRTFCNNELNPILPNLVEFAQQSLVFTDAHSPGPKAVLSLPGILFQTDLPPLMRYPEMGFERDGQFVPASAFDSIFSCVADRHYHSVMLGFAYPSGLWLGDTIDCCRVYNYTPKGRNIAETMLMQAFSATRQMSGPWFSSFCKTFDSRYKLKYYLGLLQGLEQDVCETLTRSPRNTFAIIHYMLPHEPFLFNEDGSILWPAWAMNEDSVKNYRANLACLDRHIGRFIDLMKKAGTFDDALIIMTSDHTWKEDPLRRHVLNPAPATHVPLFIKIPGQTQSATITDRYELYRLKPLIEFALRQKGGDLDGALCVVKGCTESRQYLARRGE